MDRVPDYGSIGKFYIQTNGSLILKNKAFFEKYAALMVVSISYDFLYQEENRTLFEVDETLKFLNSINLPVQLQWVIPTGKKGVFGLETYANVVKHFRTYKLNGLVLILHRHTVTTNGVKTIIADESIDLTKFFLAFMQFIQLLYVSNIRFCIDGHSKKFEKDYYHNHKQLVLAPNGLILPEYQFIEYDKPEYAIGRWKDGVVLHRDEQSKSVSELFRDECKKCPISYSCGLRYIYAMHDEDPANAARCQLFYTLNMVAIKHFFKLKEQPTLLQHLGVQE
jgi:radical SAM protein with 4Fe4S-binding SPASM domain